MKKLSLLAASALLVISTATFAESQEPSSTYESAEQKKSQLQEQKLAGCWIWTGTEWIRYC